MIDVETWTAVHYHDDKVKGLAAGTLGFSFTSYYLIVKAFTSNSKIALSIAGAVATACGAIGCIWGLVNLDKKKTKG